jgi:hypothetical protein
MFSEQHYRTCSALAQELSELPENVRRRKAYIALSIHWKKLADIVARLPSLVALAPR